MEIIKSWIVGWGEHLVKLEDGTYMLGNTTNIYGYSHITEKEALQKIEESKPKPKRDPYVKDFEPEEWVRTEHGLERIR